VCPVAACGEHGPRRRTIGEDNLLSGVLELLSLQVELAAHGILGFPHVRVQQVGVEDLALLRCDRRFI
jgi:hypothetical protein